MLRVRHLGRVPYGEASALQHALVERAADDYLLVLEHPHTFTLGVRADPAHVLVDPHSVGADLQRTDRGGDVTYHGPGQLVAYPIVTVADHPGAGRRHVEALEDLVMAAVADVWPGAGRAGVGRLAGYPGVWVGVGTATPRKLAAIGVRIVRARGSDPASHRVRTLHGVALNVECDLQWFRRIVPCGIEDFTVTSLREEGCRATGDEVCRALVRHAVARWGQGGNDAQAVTRGPAAPAVTAEQRAAPPLLRRLRQAGVDPDLGLPLASRKPEWLRVPVRHTDRYRSLGATLRQLELVTVCEEAGCPNIYECWAEGTATFMVNGSRCTRSCGFCLVDTERPLPLDPEEPERVAAAVDRMGLAHAVVTCVARDDLPDGGAGAIAATVRAVRRRSPHTAVEVLISDCKGDESALSEIFATRPDVLNHNIETVARLQRAVRPAAGYARSLGVLARATDAGLVAKSGLMVGLGESLPEVRSTLADLRAVGVSIVTVGQYLRPSAAHLPVARWWTPEEFDLIAEEGRRLGFSHVQASPLTRSSYHARGAAESAGVARHPVALAARR